MSNKGEMPRWQYRIDGSQVDIGPGLDVVSVQDSAGRDVGTLFGFPIDLSGQKRLTGGVHRVAAQLEDNPDRFAEAVIEDLGGRFVWLFRCENVDRLYLDAGGQIPCVFDPDLGACAASAMSLLDGVDYDARFDEALHDRLGVSGLGWIPGGLTAHRGVRRLLPNHYLNLSDFSVHRHWPYEPIGQGDGVAEASALVTSVRAQMTALMGEERPVAQALTAGRETRMLLGCARPWIEQTDFVTIDAGAGHVDTVLAAKIAKGEGLNHRVLPQKMAQDSQVRDYLRRNGDCIADGNARSHPSVAPLAERHVFVGGSGGEVGRGFFWRAGDQEDTPLDGAALMNRFGLPPEPQVIAALDAWCAGLAGVDTFTMLDLAYIEHRMAPWGGAQFPSDPTLVRFAPLVTRPGIRAMMSMPEPWKRGEGMSDAVISATWPELALYPFNTLGKLRDGLAKLRKVLRDPAAIMRKLRKKFG